MSSIISKLIKSKLIEPEHSFVGKTVYEVQMGSVAYGVDTPDSDADVYGVCVPDKEMVFPHLAGYIHGFGKNPPVFENFTKHHIMYDNKEYDISVFSIVRFFSLCASCSPNVLEALFVPDDCVLKMDSVGKLMRENRHLFLSRRAYDRLTGIAFYQLKKMEKAIAAHSGRGKPAYDAADAYHIVRFMLQAEQILTTGNLDLRLNSEQISEARQGKYSFAELTGWFGEQEAKMLPMYAETGLPANSDFNQLQTLLHKCLQMHYDSDDLPDTSADDARHIITKIQKMVTPSA